MATKKKQYEGSVYIGVVGSETEIGVCRDSIISIARRASDTPPMSIRATKGYEARQMHIDNFMASNHSFILLLDHDMIFPVHTLERLLSHGLPYVSGEYMRRRYSPVAPVWFENAPKGQPVLTPWTIPTPENAVYPIGATGWGCVLIHRDVITAVRGLLKGEGEVLEDDMDIYPYDLARIMEAIRGLNELASATLNPANLIPALKAHIETLQNEIKPLRGVKDTVGSDIRFPFFAKMAGYQLFCDSGVRCDHVLNYPLSPGDFASMPVDTVKDLQTGIQKGVTNERKRIKTALDKIGGSK
jgi:hypothetical protein